MSPVTAGAVKLKSAALPDQQLIDNHALERSLRHLSHDASDNDLTEALQQVIVATCEIFSATGAGLMMIDDTSMLRYVAATDETGRLLETRQAEIGHGPCVDTLTFDQVVCVNDLAADGRWPALVPELPDAGVRGLLGVPIHVDRMPVAALNVYRDHPAEWPDSEIRALQAYGMLIESLLEAALTAHGHGQLVHQLQHALDHRVVIERALGVLMGRENIDAVSAFNRLRQVARSSERKVADVAAALLDQIVGNVH